MANDFEKCGKWLIEGCRDGWIVCHGMRLGQHHEDVFSHCWLEYPEQNQAIVMSHERKMILVEADLYRQAMSLYTIDEFNCQQLRARVNREKHFGPFDKDLRELAQRVLH